MFKYMVYDLSFFDDFVVLAFYFVFFSIIFYFLFKCFLGSVIFFKSSFFFVCGVDG